MDNTRGIVGCWGGFGRLFRPGQIQEVAINGGLDEKQFLKLFKKICHKYGKVNLQDNLLFREEAYKLINDFFDLPEDSCSEGSSSSSSILDSQMYNSDNVQITGTLETFDGLMNDDGGRQVFGEYLQSVFADENLRFWEAVNSYEKLESWNSESAMAVYNTYLKPDSPMEINIPYNLHKLISETVATPTGTIFREAKKHIYELMKKDVYPRFKVSQFYLDKVTKPPRRPSIFASFKEAANKKTGRKLSFPVQNETFETNRFLMALLSTLRKGGKKPQRKAAALDLIRQFVAAQKKENKALPKTPETSGSSLDLGAVYMGPSIPGATDKQNDKFHLSAQGNIQMDQSGIGFLHPCIYIRNVSRLAVALGLNSSSEGLPSAPSAVFPSGRTKRRRFEVDL